MYINLNFGLKLKILGPFPQKENYKWAHKTKKKKITNRCQIPNINFVVYCCINKILAMIFFMVCRIVRYSCYLFFN